MCDKISETCVPTDDDKRLVFDGLCYQLERFLATYNLLLSYKKTNLPNPSLTDAIFESFLIHARNLFDFFTKPERRGDKDDVLAIDYVSDWKEKKGEVNKKHNYISSNLARINKMLAHLTYSGRELEKTWQVRDIYDDIQAFFIDFSKNVDPKYFTDRWKNRDITEFLQTSKSPSSIKISFPYCTGGNGPISSKFSP